MTARACAALALIALSAGCGYHIAGQADTIPDEVRAIAVPPFVNGVTEFKIEQYLTDAVVREFRSRTRYEVVEREENADATLRGSVLSFLALPANFDPQTGRATTVNTITVIHVTLQDRQSGQVLYQNPRLEHRDRYEVSSDSQAYFEERQAALARAGESMARTLVSAVLEGF